MKLKSGKITGDQMVNLMLNQFTKPANSRYE